MASQDEIGPKWANIDRVKPKDGESLDDFIKRCEDILTAIKHKMLAQVKVAIEDEDKAEAERENNMEKLIKHRAKKSIIAKTEALYVSQRDRAKEKIQGMIADNEVSLERKSEALRKRIESYRKRLDAR